LPQSRQAKALLFVWNDRPRLQGLSEQTGLLQLWSTGSCQPRMHHEKGDAAAHGVWNVFPIGPPQAPVPFANPSRECHRGHLHGLWKTGPFYVQRAQVVLRLERHVVFQLRIAGTFGVRLRSAYPVSLHQQSRRGATRNRTGRSQFHVSSLFDSQNRRFLEWTFCRNNGVVAAAIDNWSFLLLAMSYYGRSIGACKHVAYS
jgi:hypothetical protein